jgi:hypothetical protein
MRLDTAALVTLTDWRDRLSAEIYAVAADLSPTVDGYTCATQERAEEVRTNIVEDALAVKALVDARIARIQRDRSSLRREEQFVQRVMRDIALLA